MSAGPSVAGRPKGRFLTGDEKWWIPPNGPIWSKSRWKESLKDHNKRRVAIFKALQVRELSAPSSCDGWRRQRLRPLAVAWLFPAAFSIGCGLLALIILLLDQADDKWGLVSAQIGMIASAGSLTFLQLRRTGPFSGMTLMMVTAFSLLGTGYLGMKSLAGNPDSDSILAWTLLLVVSIYFVLRGGSSVVSSDGSRWLLPIKVGTSIRYEGEELPWKEGRIASEKIAQEFLTLEVERIRGQCFLVMNNTANFGIRKEALAKNGNQVVRKRAIAIMQSNAGKSCIWPDWALPDSEEE